MRAKLGGTGAIVLAAGVSVRLLFWLLYEPTYFADSPHYEWLASNILEFNLENYDGVRLPGYPLLLALSGLNWYVVWFWQSLAGLASAYFLYDLVWNRLGAKTPALIAGLIPTLQLNLLFAEANILTESMAIFWLLFTLWLWQRAGRNGWSFLGAILIGLTATMAGFTRPLLLLLPCLLILWVIFYKSEVGGKPAVIAIGLGAPFLLLTLSWSFFNWQTVGYFGPTTLTGYNLIRHAGAYAAYAPDEYVVIRDIFLEYREAAIADGSDHTVAIWRAREEMQQATGLDYAELSQELTRMSLWLFWNRPLDYSRSTFEAWTLFWRKENLWQLRAIHPSVLQPVLAVAWWLQGRLLLGADILFWGVCIAYLRRFWRGRLMPDELSWFVITLILLTSVAQALLEYGENARYAIPYQPLIWYVIIVASWPWLIVLRNSRPNNETGNVSDQVNLCL